MGAAGLAPSGARPQASRLGFTLLACSLLASGSPSSIHFHHFSFSSYSNYQTCKNNSRLFIFNIYLWTNWWNTNINRSGANIILDRQVLHLLNEEQDFFYTHWLPVEYLKRQISGPIFAFKLWWTTELIIYLFIGNWYVMVFVSEIMLGNVHHSKVFSL